MIDVNSDTLPHDNMAEKSVLGSVILQPERLDEVASILQPTDFFDSENRSIYRAMLDLRTDGKPIDVITLTSTVEGVEYLAVVIGEVAECVPHAANAVTYARTVKDAAIRRQLFSLSDDLKSFAGNGKPTAEIVEDTRYALEDIGRTIFGRQQAEVLTMSQIEQMTTDWLWESWLPRGTLSVLDGDPGLGKSTITIDIASRVSTGRPMPPSDGENGTYEPADVLLLSAEDDPRRTIRGRVDAAGADLSRIHYLGSMDDGTRPPELPRDIPILKQIVVDRGVGFVVIDPLMAYLSGNTDSHKDSDVRRVLHRLARMAEETECSVLLVRHLCKDSGRRAKYRGGGSIGILGAARSAMMVGEDPDDPDCSILAVSKANLAPVPNSLRYGIKRTESSSKIAWFGECELTADQIGQRQPGNGKSKVESCGDFLVELLTAGARPSEEVMRLCRSAGHKDRTVYQARKERGIVATKIGGQWTMSLPEGG